MMKGFFNFNPSTVVASVAIKLTFKYRTVGSSYDNRRRQANKNLLLRENDALRQPDTKMICQELFAED